MVVSTIHLTARQGKRRELWRTLQSLRGSICRDPGCLSHHVYVDIDDHSVFCWEGLWRTDEALRAFFSTNTGTILLGAIQLLCKTPDLRIDANPKTGGLDVIQAAREQSLPSVV